jgi:hypothetical protein
MGESGLFVSVCRRCFIPMVRLEDGSWKPSDNEA